MQNLPILHTQHTFVHKTWFVNRSCVIPNLSCDTATHPPPGEYSRHIAVREMGHRRASGTTSSPPFSFVFSRGIVLVVGGEAMKKGSKRGKLVQHAPVLNC